VTFKVAIAGAVAASFLGAGLVAPASAGDSASLTIRAFVPLSCDIQVEADESTQLDLSEGQKDALVATLWETCNVLAGYKVTISSEGNGRFAPETLGGTEEIPYELKYDAAPAKLSGSRDAPVAVTDSTTTTKGQGIRRPLTISYRPSKTAIGGGYTDTLTFTISPR
jgi:hypothetical protein